MPLSQSGPQSAKVSDILKQFRDAVHLPVINPVIGFALE